MSPHGGGIERFLRLASLDDRDYRASKLATFRLLFVLHMTVGLGIWGWQWHSDWRQLVFAPLLVCTALVYVGKWVRPALAVVLACMIVKLLSFPPLLIPDFVANHSFLEFLCVLLLLLLAADDDREQELCLQALRWLTVSVLFYTGLQKLWYGTYLNGQYLALQISTNEGFRDGLGWLVGSGEVDRLVGYLQYRPAFDKDVLLAPFPGPYTVSSTLFVIASNAVWIAEMALPVLLLVRRTRIVGLIGTALLIVAIEAFAHELLFGALFANLLLLFAVRDLNRRLIPAFAVLYAFILAARFGVIPVDIPL